MRAFVRTVFLPLALLLAGETWAQGIPDHAPGSICLTNQFWCWADSYGPVGAPCTCPSAQGLTAGQYV